MQSLQVGSPAQRAASQFTLVSRRTQKEKIEFNKKVLKEEKIIVVVDETGDRKKGKKTDYVARQYLGSVGKIDMGNNY